VQHPVLLFKRKSNVFLSLCIFLEIGNFYPKPGIIEIALFGRSFYSVCCLLGQGRYGSVWRGKVGELEVAVKVFPPQHRMYFYNERDSYCLPFMNHYSLLTYFGKYPSSISSYHREIS